MSPEKNSQIPIKDVEIDDPQMGWRDEEKELMGEDYMFLLGLGLFISFLALAHPIAPEIPHQILLFWMSITMLLLSMAPDYVNREQARKWLEEYRNTKLEGLYRRIFNVAENSDRYFSSKKFFLLGILLALTAVFVFFYTGEVQEIIFGISSGVFIRAILV